MVGFKQERDRLIVSLCGDVDHCAAQQLRGQIESQIEKIRPKQLRLDFSKVDFMDSSGIGMIIGRYKTMMKYGGQMTAAGMTESVFRLFCMAGLHRIIAVEDIRKETEA